MLTSPGTDNPASRTAAIAAMAVRRQDYTGALVATAAGAAGVLLIERLLRDSAKAVQERKDV